MNAPRILVVTPPEGPLDAVHAALAADGPEVAVWLRRPGAPTRALMEEGAGLVRRLGGARRL
ncbi:MAG: hypothetical protein AAGH15_07835, partial [Myxococcota bacterium]